MARLLRSADRRSVEPIAEQRNDNSDESGTIAKTSNINRRKERKARRHMIFRAEPESDSAEESSITVKPIKKQSRNPVRRAKQRRDNVAVAGSGVALVRRDKHPRRPEHQAEQHYDFEVPNDTSSIKMFADLGRPRQDEPKTWLWQMRMLAWRRNTMTMKEYYKIDWKNEIDLQRFQSECVEYDNCWIDMRRKNWPVPMPCEKHRLGTSRMWRLLNDEIAQRAEAEAEAKKRESEAALEEKPALFDRAVLEHPDLSLRGRLWEPVGPGVARITGTLLEDVATFFRDCDINVEEDNLIPKDRSYKKEGREIVAQIQSGSDEIRWSTKWHAQVRISIDKFRQPCHVGDPEHYGDAAVRDLKGRYGNAFCAVILYLGRTGQPAQEKIDSKCCYWLYSAYEFPALDLSKIGHKSPFRMVRLPKVSHRDHNDFMMRFGLKTGKERAKAFSDRFNHKVKQLQVTPLGWKDFYDWARDELPEVPADLVELVDDPDEDDPGQDNPGEEDPHDEDTHDEDPGEDSPGENDPREDTGNEHAQDPDRDLSYLVDLTYLDDEDEDEDMDVDEDVDEHAQDPDPGLPCVIDLTYLDDEDEDEDLDLYEDMDVDEQEDVDEHEDGAQWPIPGTKANIPRHLRRGGKA